VCFDGAEGLLTALVDLSLGPATKICQGNHQALLAGQVQQRFPHIGHDRLLFLIQRLPTAPPSLLITFTTTVIWIRAIVLIFTMEKIYLVYHERSSFFDRELTQRTYLLEL
jgi:hypothetical protein